MLVTNVGGLPEIVPNGKVGYSVEPEAKVIADAINDFYSNGRYAEFVGADIVIELELEIAPEIHIEHLSPAE